MATIICIDRVEVTTPDVAGFVEQIKDLARQKLGIDDDERIVVEVQIARMDVADPHGDVWTLSLQRLAQRHIAARLDRSKLPAGSLHAQQVCPSCSRDLQMAPGAGDEGEDLNLGTILGLHDEAAQVQPQVGARVLDALSVNGDAVPVGISDREGK